MLGLKLNHVNKRSPGGKHGPSLLEIIVRAYVDSFFILCAAIWETKILINHIYCILTCFANRPHAAGVAVGYIDSALMTATYDPQSTHDIRDCMWLLRSQSWWLSQQVRTCAHRFLYNRKIIYIYTYISNFCLYLHHDLFKYNGQLFGPI